MKEVAIFLVQDLAMPDVLVHVKHRVLAHPILYILVKIVIIHAKRHAKINVPVLVKVLVPAVRERARINVPGHVKVVVELVLAVVKEVARMDVKKVVQGLAVVDACTLVIPRAKEHARVIVTIHALIRVRPHVMAHVIIHVWE